MNNDKGISVVLLNTEHGKALFESVADKVAQCESKVEYAIAGHPFPSPLMRAYTRVRGVLGRVKRKVVG
jgi:hypothetical protein